MSAEILDQEYRPAIPLGELQQHPENARRGDDDTVTDSIESNGFYGAIIVQKSTGFVIAGNTRYRSLSAAGNESVPGFVIDCDDAKARRIMLYDNRSADRAEYDDPLRAELLLAIRDEQGDLIGTGYDDVDLDLLLSAGEAAEPVGGYIPEDVPTGSYEEQYGVIVVCQGQEQQQEIYAELAERGLEVRVVVT